MTVTQEQTQICAECGEPKPLSAFREGRHADVCFACRVGSVQFTSMSPRAEDVRKRDRKFEKDAAAYKRLRKEGLQPRGVDNSALLETMADHRAQVDLGRPIAPEQIKAYNRDIGPIA